MTLANKGVTTAGPPSGAAEAVVEVLGAEGLSVGGVHATVNAAIPTSTAKVRQRQRMFPYCSGSGSCRASGSGLNCGGCSTSSVAVASGSMSFSVRNMKKNTTQPIAEMKIQLINR
jgi:hypothetical protein